VYWPPAWAWHWLYRRRQVIRTWACISTWDTLAVTTEFTTPIVLTTARAIITASTIASTIANTVTITTASTTITPVIAIGAVSHIIALIETHTVGTIGITGIIAIPTDGATMIATITVKGVRARGQGGGIKRSKKP